MSVVNVRVWALDGVDGVPTDEVIKNVMAKVVDIWHKHGVQLTVDGTIRRITITPPGGETGHVLTALVAERLAAKMRDSMLVDGVGWVQVALVPRLGAWGQSYSPLTVLKPRVKGNPDTPAVFNRFDPFPGPVAIITTKTAAADTTVDRQGFAALKESQHTTAELVNIATANDIAHELGHLFGLWHTTELTRDITPAYTPSIPSATKNAHDLMYETLYSQATSYRANRTDSDARDIVRKGFPHSDELQLTKAPRPDPQVDEGWYVLFRGTDVSDLDKAVAQGNIDTSKVWHG